MPLRTAARRCPEAVFLPSDPPTYEAASEQVMATLRRFPVVVEVLGWDEAFLGAHTGDPETLAADVQRAVKQATGLVCSVGIGDNRLRAKLATGFAKPAGIYRLTRENWMRVMAERPTEALWGIGPKTAKKLAAAGITSVYQLAATDTGELARRFGPTMGPWYRALALGAGGTDLGHNIRGPGADYFSLPPAMRPLRPISASETRDTPLIRGGATCSRDVVDTVSGSWGGV
jgi:DNA polymerase-4